LFVSFHFFKLGSEFAVELSLKAYLRVAIVVFGNIIAGFSILLFTR